MVRQLPHSIETEQAVLGLMITNPDIINMVVDTLADSDFFDSRHRLIYQAIKDLHYENHGIDLNTVINRLKDKKQNDNTGGINYILEIISQTASRYHLETYLAIIKDDSIKRDVIEVAQQIAQEGLSKQSITANEFLDKAEESIFAISQNRRSSDFKQIEEVIHSVKDQIEKSKGQSEITGLATGISQLDKITSGLQPEELIILAARPGMGKSALAMNLAINVARLNRNGQAGVAIFSLEMNNEQLVMRMLSRETDINNRKFRSGYLEAHEWKNFEVRSQILKSLNIFFDDSSVVNLSEIRSKCRKLRQEGKLDFIIIDYLQLIDEKGSNRQEVVARISRSLKQLARELKVPVLALSQLSRALETRGKDDRRPILADLRESGSIEQDADIVMFLYREDHYDRERRGSSTSETELILEKNRSGSLGTVNLIFFPEFSRFEETFIEEGN